MIKPKFVKFLLTINLSFMIGLATGCLINAQANEKTAYTEIIKSIEVTAQPTETETKIEPILESLGVVELTAYCSCDECCGKSDGITSTGTKATAGRTIAVDPNIIPYGSKVVINGHTYIAEDCGCSIQNRRIDIFFDTHNEAVVFGRQQAEVFIEREGENDKL